MTTNKDILIRFLLLVALYELVYNIDQISFLQINIVLPILIVLIAVISYFFTLKSLKDKKRVSELIKQDLVEMNYTILSERPLTLKEQYENFEFDFGPFINGMSVNVLRYKSEIKRHFVVRNEKDHDFELIITIIQTWRNKFKFRIESSSRIRN